MHGLAEGYQEVLMQKVAQDKSSLMMYHLFITEGRERGHTHKHTQTPKLSVAGQHPEVYSGLCKKTE